LIKALTFDLWNTLISDKDYTDQRVKCLNEALHGENIFRDQDEMRDAYIASHDYAHKIWRSENYRHTSAEERLNYILERLSVKLSGNLKDAILEGFVEPVINDPPPLIEGTRETIASLSQRYKMGVISDTGITLGKVLRKVLANYQVLGFFEATVFSDEVGYSKPHSLMFQTALKRLKVEPSETVHVGDLLHTDIAGAKAIGMKTAWLNRKGIPNTGPHKPDCEIKTLPELISVLKNCNFL